MSLVKLGTPVCFTGSSEMGIAELIKYAAELSQKEGFVELFDARAEIYPRLLPAYLGAMVRRHEGILRSKSVAKEILMLVSGKMNVSNAIRECGIASSSYFLCLASSRRVAREFMGIANVKNPRFVGLVPGKEIAPRVAITPILDS
ncbi:MAG: hypothetical protein KGH61_02730 [Candidatus Micrarchaeota archaeon]|nr:hypothetical protein [Candidatus Micrarchaeota archaeon]MDE1847840.1 hypothetical protein [Candidatus Micrarchaeota archaeon]MDE1864354.1 hypothetical protein [Candidatus Micrarchaeota archaeon]